MTLLLRCYVAVLLCHSVALLQCGEVTALRCGTVTVLLCNTQFRGSACCRVEHAAEVLTDRLKDATEQLDGLVECDPTDLGQLFGVANIDRWCRWWGSRRASTPGLDQFSCDQDPQVAGPRVVGFMLHCCRSRADLALQY